MRKYTLKELVSIPTISSGKFDNLKIETRNIKVWLSRMTVADGQPYNNLVTVEKLVDCHWKTIEEYEAK